MICWVLQWRSRGRPSRNATISAGAIVIVERRVEFNAALAHKSFTVQFGSSAEMAKRYLAGRSLT